MIPKLHFFFVFLKYSCEDKKYEYFIVFLNESQSMVTSMVQGLSLPCNLRCVKADLKCIVNKIVRQCSKSFRASLAVIILTFSPN
jgi:hypothetical protein